MIDELSERYAYAMWAGGKNVAIISFNMHSQTATGSATVITEGKPNQKKPKIRTDSNANDPEFSAIYELVLDALVTNAKVDFATILAASSLPIFAWMGWKWM